jgi:hypothetical protein
MIRTGHRTPENLRRSCQGFVVSRRILVQSRKGSSLYSRSVKMVLSSNVGDSQRAMNIVAEERPASLSDEMVGVEHCAALPER